MNGLLYPMSLEQLEQSCTAVLPAIQSQKPDQLLPRDGRQTFAHSTLRVDAHRGAVNVKEECLVDHEHVVRQGDVAEARPPDEQHPPLARAPQGIDREGAEHLFETAKNYAKFWLSPVTLTSAVGYNAGEMHQLRVLVTNKARLLTGDVV